MNVQDAYEIWSQQYDTNVNKTRDLEAIALRQCLDNQKYEHCLEIGCGTGKNTEWLVTIAENVVAVDFSEQMLAKAKQKIGTNRVTFVQADITNEWNFVEDKSFDLATFSLVLEHIENLDEVFQKLSPIMQKNGLVYIGELHPCKQYNGSQARFDDAEGRHNVPCFTHHISEFVHSAKRNDFHLIDLNEYFDEDKESIIPRVLTLLFVKK